ncbi:MAG: ATP-binding protein [Roseburia sp.]
MPLNNSQYSELIREYDARQLANQRLLEQRIQDAYQRFPRLKEIEDAIASCSVKQAAKLLDGDTAALSELKQQIAAYRAEKEEIFAAAGFPADYFDPIYTCKDCKDTGYIGRERCHCFRQAAIDLVYTQSNLKDVLATENFDHFSFDFYSDKDTDPATGMTSLEAAHSAYSKCRDFISRFGGKDAGNLCFYGNTGIGKTFLSNCIAKELMDQGHSVIYFTAFQLFDILSKGVFDKDEEALAAHRNIFDCDLLIIDDLGTEFSNSFTTSQLFLCVNERILRNKSTIISTNLGLNQIADLYSERVLSRITSKYTLIKLFGADIRILKKTMPQKSIH